MYRAVQSRVVVTIARCCTVWHKTNGVHMYSGLCDTRPGPSRHYAVQGERGPGQDWWPYIIIPSYPGTYTYTYTCCPVTVILGTTHPFWGSHQPASSCDILWEWDLSLLETLLWLSSSKGRTTECGLLCNKEACLYLAAIFYFVPNDPNYSPELVSQP